MQQANRHMAHKLDSHSWPRSGYSNNAEVYSTWPAKNGKPDGESVTVTMAAKRRCSAASSPKPRSKQLWLKIPLLNDGDKPASPALLQGINAMLNTTPVSYLDMDCPNSVFSKHLAKLQPGGG